LIAGSSWLLQSSTLFAAFLKFQLFVRAQFIFFLQNVLANLYSFCRRNTLELQGFTCTLVSPLCVYKISQENQKINMENHLKQTKLTCVKHRFASVAHKYRLTSPPKFDMLTMLGGRMAVSFLQQKKAAPGG
jgi:hypothetical protein